jgi:hypothetical protein
VGRGVNECVVTAAVRLDSGDDGDDDCDDEE